MTTALVRNWTDFQHYSNRSPPWIKLHRNLLDNYDFQRLPLASQALLMKVWLLAAESNDGTVCIDLDFLAFRLRQSETAIAEALGPLVDREFLKVASDVLATSLHDAPLERGERETEGEREKTGADAPTPRRTRKKSPEVTFSAWTESLGDAEAIPADDPVFVYAERAGLPHDFVLLAWAWFQSTYGSDGPRATKTYADWRATFRNAVEGRWGKLWDIGRDGDYYLTAEGKQARKVFS